MAKKLTEMSRAALSGEGKVWEHVETTIRYLAALTHCRHAGPSFQGCEAHSCREATAALAAMKGA